MPNFLRTPSGPDWALVGDAGCHKDPFLALGVADALRDAELLAERAHFGLTGEQPMTRVLREYELDRNAATISNYRENIAAARFLPSRPRFCRGAGCCGTIRWPRRVSSRRCTG